VQVIRFDVLPDDVLLDIIDFTIGASSYYTAEMKAWQTLVYVCQRWRRLVFQSPRRLNLRLVCTLKRRTKDPGTLDVWPVLPLIVQGISMAFSLGTANIIAALEQSSRVCQVYISGLLVQQLEQVSAAMQVPFPELTHLNLSLSDERPPVIPDSFLGGSAPHLLHFELNRIPFPGLPNLLLSATRLVQLRLYNIPHSGYISPEAIVSSPQRFVQSRNTSPWICLPSIST
jgi:hypothetical protein